MTPPFTRILCLANSWKHGERCIAGIDLATGRWVRPVADTEDGRVPREARLLDGREPALLDLIDVPLAASGPDFGFACENRAILPGPWRFAGLASPLDLRRHALADGPILHSDTNPVPTATLRSLPPEQRASLALVRTAEFTPMRRVDRATGLGKWYADLRTHDGRRLVAAITDPVCVAHLEAGYRPSDQCFVAVALGMPHRTPEQSEDHCWKLVASVVDVNATSYAAGTGPKPIVLAARGIPPLWLGRDGRTLVAGVGPEESSVAALHYPLRGLNIWDVPGRRKQAGVAFPEAPGPVAIRRDGALLARQHGPAVELLDRSGRVTVLSETARVVTGLHFLPGNGLVVASSASSPLGLHSPAGEIRNVASRGLRCRLVMPARDVGGSSSLGSLCSSGDGKTLAGVLAGRDRDDVICLWDSAGNLLQTASPADGLAVVGPLSSLALHPTEPLLAVGSWDGSVTVWDVREWSLVHVVPGATRRIVAAVAFSPRGRWLAYGTGSRPGYPHFFERDRAVLIDWPSRREVAALGHHEIVADLAFSDDESTLATFSIDGVVKAWVLPGGADE